ncbi:MAG: sugar phosphate isomerase/epimerase [Tannerellaceae bacterium]|nr:sugar phosphate isomerase/epimerase [Tannerellaceae bacterium]
MTTRRNFLRKSIAGVAAMTAAPAINVAAPAANKNATAAPAATAANKNATQPLRLSTLSYSFHGLAGAGMMDVFHFFESCRYRYGLDTADLWNGMFTSTDDEFIDKVHLALEERQLVIPNIAVDGAHIMPAGKDDPAQLRGMQDRYMQIAKRLSVGFVRFDAGPYMSEGRNDADGWTDQEFDYIVKRYKELAAFAYDNGFKVGAENHWGPECYWTCMEQLIKAVDHPGFGICMHFGGWHGTKEENRAQEKAAAPYVAHTHIPWDCCEDPALLQRLKVLKDVNYPGYYSVEHHSGKNEYKMVAIQLEKVKAVLTGWQ